MTKQQALINTQLHSGVGEGVHSAVEGAINKYYTDAEAAAKEIDKINNKILTDNIISKQIDSALQGENGTDGAWVAEQLASNLSSKALGTLFKDAKKAVGEEQAGQLRDELDTTLRSKMSELLSGVDLEVNATGFKNILNHLVPSNYSFTFSLGESYRIRHGVSVIEIISDKFPISMRIGLPIESSAVTVNQNCASGMRAMEIACQNVFCRQDTRAVFWTMCAPAIRSLSMLCRTWSATR